MPIYKVDGKKKDGKQAYKVRINYTDISGKPRQLTRMAYGLDEAKLMEMSLSQTKTNDITLDELFSVYTESIKTEIRQSTLNAKENVYRLWIGKFLGCMKISKLSKQVLSEWKASVQGDIGYKKRIFSEFKALLNFAVKMDYLPRNNLNAIGNFRDTEFKKEVSKFDFYTVEEFQRFMSVIEDYDYYTFFAIAFLTGMRKGEITALKWTDIDGDAIHITRSIYKNGKEYQETAPKNKSSVRDIKMPIELISVLDHQRIRQEKEKGFSPQFRVCGGKEHLSTSGITKANSFYSNLADVKKIRVHDFRHSHATYLANNGINIQEISRRLGHSNVSITMNTYAHLYPQEQDRATEILNRVKIVQ